MASPSLILIRGIPGSGKSTIAAQMAKAFGFVHLEADQWFVNSSTGEYKYEPACIGDAHNWCKAAMACQLQRGKGVIVANTFVRVLHLMDYIQVAYNATSPRLPVLVLTARGSYQNVHGVPQSKVEQMRNNWEEWQ